MEEKDKLILSPWIVVQRFRDSMKGVRCNWPIIAISLAPFLCYLIVFKNYAILRSFFGLDVTNPPNYEILQDIEMFVFDGYLPHRILSSHPLLLLDFLAAIPYLVHFPLPFLFGYYLYATPRRRKQLPAFVWFAGWVNLLAVLVQLFYPTAPPWFRDSMYVRNGEVLARVENEAGFARIDAFLNIKLFHSIYGASPVKFGAMPSLHIAWPACILMAKPWGSTRIGIIHLIWIFWAALYSNHHYAIDGIAGILLVVLVNAAMLRIYCPFKTIPSLFVVDLFDLDPLLPVRNRSLEVPDRKT